MANEEWSPGHDQIAAKARELWRARGGSGGSPEQDWYLAEQLLRDENVLTSVRNSVASRGNSPSAGESYLSGARSGSASAQSNFRKEDRHTMAQDNQSWHNQQPSGQGGTGVMDKVKETINKSGVGDKVNNLANEAGNYINREPVSMPRPEHREGPIARSIEQQTARIPSDAWLWAAVGSIGLSLALELSGKEKTANFVGHWAPTFLIFGLYNKMVKLQGSDGI